MHLCIDMLCSLPRLRPITSMMPVGSRPSSWYFDWMQIKVALASHHGRFGLRFGEFGSLFGMTSAAEIRRC